MGGSASYPPFSNNADKVLAVNSTEDAVEWVTVSLENTELTDYYTKTEVDEIIDDLPSGGGSGGINVIEYDPNLHEQATPVVNADWIPVGDSAVWDSATGIMGVGTPITVWSKGYEFSNGATSDCSTQYAALKLDLATLFATRSITIDAALCNDAFGFMFMPKGARFRDVFEGRWFLPQNPNYPNETFMIFTTAQKVLGEYFFDLYGKEYIDNVQSYTFRDHTRNTVETIKPQGIYTIFREEGLSSFLRQEGYTTEQEFIDYLVSEGATLEELLPELNEMKKNDYIGVTSLGISESVSKSLFTENMDLYLVMTPYVGNHAQSFTLDPTSQIQITYDLVNISHSIPSGVVDGDILHLTEKASISGKIISKDSFIQLYANKTKYIPLSGTVKSFEE